MQVTIFSTAVMGDNACICQQHTHIMHDDTLGYYSTADLREAARRRLPKGLFEFMDRGNDDEVAMRENRIALESIKLSPRVLIDVTGRSQEITLFGKTQKMPVIVAPTGSTGLAWYEGEIALARAARTHGVPFTLALGSMPWVNASPSSSTADFAAARM